MTRRKKRVFPGSQQALDELHMSKFRLTIACRLIQSFVREGIYLVKQCERYRSTSNFGRNIEETVRNISLVIQDVTREGNTACRVLERFNNTNKGE